jgi:hypothetical protein
VDGGTHSAVLVMSSIPGQDIEAPWGAPVIAGASGRVSFVAGKTVTDSSWSWITAAV